MNEAGGHSRWSTRVTGRTRKCCGGSARHLPESYELTTIHTPGGQLGAAAPEPPAAEPGARLRRGGRLVRISGRSRRGRTASDSAAPGRIRTTRPCPTSPCRTPRTRREPAAGPGVYPESSSRVWGITASRKICSTGTRYDKYGRLTEKNGPHPGRVIRMNDERRTVRIRQPAIVWYIMCAQHGETQRRDGMCTTRWAAGWVSGYGSGAQSAGVYGAGEKAK
ncbi:hypothetical protein KCP76_20365 [Salmonella enterica subsp. enterica serovar Weltevreden]|nr:hypothetical protein KCP76_20365 [Salmonella enterica subsp. enterica serovar Weltevreden]